MKNSKKLYMKNSKYKEAKIEKFIVVFVVVYILVILYFLT
jgi:hypothetical protein